MRLLRKELIGTAVLALLFGVFALAHDDRGKGSKESAYRLGYTDGQRDGLRHGQADRDRGVGFDPNSRELRQAGNDVRIDHKGDYKKGYREGYQIGYREGYEQRGGVYGRYPDRSTYPGDSRYPNPDQGRYPYPDQGRYPDRGRGTAFDMGMDRGYRDGNEKGRSDYDKRRSPDVRRHDWYNDADRGYSSSYGNKRDYQAGYRNGFQRGYDEVYGGRGTSGRSGGSIWDNIWRRR
ncbi:MAG TPA: hypothetical protein VGQ81_14915 [Acidobacteriota bacterium]|jgi:hypothetical protein|nr:hypothetical protein [Acidobacteriota bacterium]